MKYVKNGISYNIPDDELQRLQKNLRIPKLDAINLWLVDNEIEVNEEQEELNKKAAGVANEKVTSGKRKQTKPRTVKISDEKQALFQSILENIDRCEGVERENVTVLKENKLIEVKIGEKIFKIDVVEKRPPKK